MRIAHLSDPHINLKYHPQHLPRLRRVLEDALGRMNADHIILTGDLTSNADTRDLRTIRRLFESLGIMKSSKLTSRHHFPCKLPRCLAQKTRCQLMANA